MLYCLLVGGASMLLYLVCFGMYCSSIILMAGGRDLLMFGGSFILFVAHEYPW